MNWRELSPMSEIIPDQTAKENTIIFMVPKPAMDNGMSKLCSFVVRSSPSNGFAEKPSRSISSRISDEETSSDFHTNLKRREVAFALTDTTPASLPIWFSIFNVQAPQ